VRGGAAATLRPRGDCLRGDRNTCARLKDCISERLAFLNLGLAFYYIMRGSTIFKRALKTRLSASPVCLRFF